MSEVQALQDPDLDPGDIADPSEPITQEEAGITAIHHLPCPKCGADAYYEDQDGETVVMCSESGVAVLVCNATPVWHPDGNESGALGPVEASAPAPAKKKSEPTAE